MRVQPLAPEAAWDRIVAETIDLYFVSLPEARQLLQARMDAVVAPGQAIPEVAAQMHEDDLYPLGQAWWQSQVNGMIDVRPRDVITWAHQRWREQCIAMQVAGETSIRGATPGDMKGPSKAR